MTVTLRQLSASTSSILIWVSVWGLPFIIEISVRKFKIRRISEVSEHTILQIKKFIVGCDVEATCCLNVFNSIFIWVSVWGVPFIIEISVRKF
jgi:hypothetical protein